MTGKLPPLSVPPRSLTPPEQRARSGEYFSVDPDAKTPRKPVELLEYQQLLACFDAMTPEQRFDLLEIASALPDLSAAERAWVVEMATKRTR